MSEVCAFSIRVIVEDGSDVRELGGEVGAIGAIPDASAIGVRDTVDHDKGSLIT